MKYLFFDTAVNGYYTLLALQKEFPGGLPLINKEENISDDVAPFLFEITDEKLKLFLLTEHISFKEVLFFESGETKIAVRDYFSRFVVQTINGRQFYFRFWAASVFVKYITTCKASQLNEFFKIVESFSCEDKGLPVQFSFNGTKLIREAFNDDAFAGKVEMATTTAPHSESEDPETIQKKRQRKFFS